jgi:ribonuclease BN (tRNA processing enzyme)
LIGCAMKQTNKPSNANNFMELTILGSGTCVPSKLRSSPGFLLSIDTQRILLDGGSGTIRRLLETHHDYKDIDYILYTHTHPDHVGDLAPLLMAMKHTPGFRREKPLSIFGPSGFKEFCAGLTRIYGGWLVTPNYELNITELNMDSRSFGDWHIITKPMNHSNSAIGYRIEHQDKVFAYSGDTGYCENVIKIAAQADIALLECSFPDDNPVEGHLTPSLVAMIAKEADCKKLVLTHLYPPCEQIDVVTQCAQIFSGDIVVAKDLHTFVI